VKLKRILLRWYKSFHLNYRGVTDKGETVGYRPWNRLAPTYATGGEFPFIEIPIESDITTIVGGNESGKSHLLNAISKVITGNGIDGEGEFKRTDLCHYAGVRTRNVEAWPNIGLQFEAESADEAAAVSKACGQSVAFGEAAAGVPRPTFVLILAPEGNGQETFAYLYVEPNEKPITLSAGQLTAVRASLPRVQFIDSRAQLASELPIQSLLAAYDGIPAAGVGIRSRRDVEDAAAAILGFSLPAAPQAVTPEIVSALQAVKTKLGALTSVPANGHALEMRLFKEILRIERGTLQYLYGLQGTDRGYIEGQVSKWNDEIADQLNLSHFWRQDEKFTLRVNYKDGIVYFEIQDKTNSIYTFKERSSGLKYFLSYYIQAKALEMSSRNRNSIILMDEPDSALSNLGQRNLLSVFESLVSPESSGQTCQLVYTTHSPYLINRNFPRRIRVVKKEDAEEGTQYIEQARVRRYEPVRTALGIDSAPSLFLGADNVLLEGPTDQFLLAELIRVFATPQNVGEFLDLNAVVIVSADGVENVKNVLEQSRWADEPVPPTAVLLDGDDAATKAIEAITLDEPTRKKVLDRSFVSTVAALVPPHGGNPRIVTMEDIVPRAIYTSGIDRYIRRWLPETVKSHASEIQAGLAAPAFGAADGLVASTKELFRKLKPDFKGDFDKMGVFQEVVAIAKDPPAGLVDPVRQLERNLIGVCEFIRDALARSRAASTKHSATQAVKRIVHDFARLNRGSVAITSIQKLFRRLIDEVTFIGTDGEPFVHVLNGYLAELEALRGAGQQRVVNDQWERWKQRIEEIRKNPLSAGTAASVGSRPPPSGPDATAGTVTVSASPPRPAVTALASTPA
jgi:predicted ATPase